MKTNNLIKLSLVVALVFQIQSAIAISNWTAPTYHDILNDLNQYRIKLNLLPITQSFVVCQLAQTRLRQIIAQGEGWSHVGFQPELDKLPYHGFFYENLARSNMMGNIPESEPSTIVYYWSISKKGHNQAMLTDLDLGCVAYANGYYVFEGYKKQFGVTDQIY